MNKKLAFIFFLPFALFTFLAVPLSASAIPASPTVQVGVVQGLVYDSSNSPLNGASVSVTCNSNTLNTSTDSSGFYFAQFGNGICPASSTATVTATKGGLSGSNTGTLTNQGTFGLLSLDIAIVNVQAVPEFGMIPGLVALVSSSGAFALLRRKLV